MTRNDREANVVNLIPFFVKVSALDVVEVINKHENTMMCQKPLRVLKCVL